MATVDRLLLLGSGSAGAIDGLLDLTGNTILGCVELRANGAILGERSTDLIIVLVLQYLAKKVGRYVAYSLADLANGAIGVELLANGTSR